RGGGQAGRGGAAAAADGDDDRVQVGCTVEDLQVGGGDARDQRGFVGGADQPHSPLGGDGAGGGARLAEVGAGLDQFGAQGADGRRLGRVGPLGHDDHARRAERGGGVGEGLGVV